MTREQYLKLRNSNQLDYSLFYDYYIIHCKEPLVKSLEEFAPLLIQFMQNFGININLVMDYFDNKFEINKLINIKTQEVIRYV